MESEEKLRNLITVCRENSFVLSVDGQVVGIIAGIIGNSMLSDRPVYQEIVWFVDEKYRKYGIKLLKHIEKWCEDNNIDQIIMALMVNSKADKLDKFYNMMGYEQFEIHYIKNLGSNNGCKENNTRL
jgi:GNAT superfamily N-acetyltransferase